MKYGKYNLSLHHILIKFFDIRNYFYIIPRSYEEKQLAAQQEKTQKRLEFEKQEGRLRQQVIF